LKKILFVCSGNTCRSPLAEGIGKRLLEHTVDSGVEVLSAGTSTVDGCPASAHSVTVARDHGIDISDHQSRFLNATLVREVDLIVTMGGNHRATVLVIDPDAEAYTRMLSEFSDELSGDIQDPIGGSRDDYDETYTSIEKCMRAMAVALPEFAGWRKKD